MAYSRVMVICVVSFPDLLPLARASGKRSGNETIHYRYNYNYMPGPTQYQF